jgi:hypothetical protein
MTEEEYKYLHQALGRYVSWKDSRPERNLCRLIRVVSFSPAYASEYLSSYEFESLDYLSKIKNHIREDSLVCRSSLAEFQTVLCRMRRRLSLWHLLSSVFWAIILGLLSVLVGVVSDWILPGIVIFGVGGVFLIPYFQVRLKTYLSTLQDFEDALDELSIEADNV